MFENIETKLTKYLSDFLPIINNNFQKSEKDWRSGIISKGAFDYINQRFVVANHIILNKPDISGEQFFDIFAPLTIDIKSGILLCNDEEKFIREAEFQEWLNCFDEIGFTDRQPVFDYPMKNLNNFNKKRSEK